MAHNEPMNTSRTMVATVEGIRHEIPEIWVAGFCQSNRCHAGDAAAYWHWQFQLDQQWNAQQVAA